MPMLCAVIPWDHTTAIAHLHIMEMDAFAQVNYFYNEKKEKAVSNPFQAGFYYRKSTCN